MRFDFVFFVGLVISFFLMEYYSLFNYTTWGYINIERVLTMFLMVLSLVGLILCLFLEDREEEVKENQKHDKLRKM